MLHRLNAALSDEALMRIIHCLSALGGTDSQLHFPVELKRRKVILISPWPNCTGNISACKLIQILFHGFKIIPSLNLRRMLSNWGIT